MTRSDDSHHSDSLNLREGAGVPVRAGGQAEGAAMNELNPPNESNELREFGIAESLHPQDSAALDDLVHAAFRIEGVQPDQRPVAQVLSGLLSLLDRGPSLTDDGGALLDITMARISRQRHQDSKGFSDVSLSTTDDDAIEALIAANYDPQRVTLVMRPRAKKAAALLGLLDAPVTSREVSAHTLSGPAEAPPQLVAQTLGRVQRAIEEHQQTMSIAGDRRGGGWSFRMQDLVSVAALLLVAVTLLAPMAMGVREYNRRTACGSNMAVAGVAFGQYGGDNKGMLPLASSSDQGNPWWFVGEGAERSNSANLYVLNRANFTTIEKLACCGNPDAPKQAPSDAVDWRSLNEVSYSYQCQFAERRPAWNGGTRVVILSDASPVVRRAVKGEDIYPFENSPNHGGRGQNVLFNDGSGAWLTTPVVEAGRSDNIWLPRRIECEIAKLIRPSHADALKGTESPDSEDDSFVGP
ncbi:MAG: hypothetical protein H7210_00190 [Pyrinomonadaceae bacterium]|nr:hypothetical protein [Phycisphaerales bacterium]